MAFKSAAPIPPQIQGVAPRGAEDLGAPPLAWGPFAIELETGGVDFGIVLRDERDDDGRWLVWDTADRRHRRRIVGAWIVRGDSLRVECDEGWTVVRPIVNADREHVADAPTTAEEPSLAEYARREFFGEA